LGRAAAARDSRLPRAEVRVYEDGNRVLFLDADVDQFRRRARKCDSDVVYRSRRRIHDVRHTHTGFRRNRRLLVHRLPVASPKLASAGVEHGLKTIASNKRVHEGRAIAAHVAAATVKTRVNFLAISPLASLTGSHVRLLLVPIVAVEAPAQRFHVIANDQSFPLPLFRCVEDLTFCPNRWRPFLSETG